MQGTLGSSLSTLEELHNLQLPVSLPVESHHRLGLSRFVALRRLTLSRILAPGHSVLERLPLGLRELALVVEPGHDYPGRSAEDRAYR